MSAYCNYHKHIQDVPNFLLAADNVAQFNPPTGTLVAVQLIQRPNSVEPTLLYGTLRRAQVEVPYHGTYVNKSRGKSYQGSTFNANMGSLKQENQKRAKLGKPQRVMALSYEEYNALLERNCALCGVASAGRLSVDRIDSDQNEYSTTTTQSACPSCQFGKGSETNDEYKSR